MTGSFGSNLERLLSNPEYDKFACFCKDTTIEKSDAIKEEQDNIDEFAATLEEQTGSSRVLVIGLL